MFISPSFTSQHTSPLPNLPASVKAREMEAADEVVVDVDAAEPAAKAAKAAKKGGNRRLSKGCKKAAPLVRGAGGSSFATW